MGIFRRGQVGRDSDEVQHLDQRPFRVWRLAGHEHDVARINGVMNDAVEGADTGSVHHLLRDPQDYADRHRSARLDPFIRGDAIEIFRHVNDLTVDDSEIVQDGNVDVLDPLRAFRFGFELLAHHAAQGRHRHYLQCDIPAFDRVLGFESRFAGAAPNDHGQADRIEVETIAFEVNFCFHNECRGDAQLVSNN